MAATAPEMSCEELVELVTDYLEDKLSSEARERFHFHLGRCPGCEDYLDQMKLSVRLLGRLSESSLPPGLKQALLEAFRDWKTRRH